MSDELYVVLHLPKTAGSTLRANFRLNFWGKKWLPLYLPMGNTQSQTVDQEIARYNSPQVRCIFGHAVYWGVHEKVRPGERANYITFLREPVARCVSLFGFTRSRPDLFAEHGINTNNWSLAQWLEAGAGPQFHNAQLRDLLFDGTNDVLLEPHLTRDHLEAAKARLREYWFVGLTETFESDALWLYGRLNFRCLMPVRVVNATRNKPFVSPEEKGVLAEMNRLDSELYEFARQLHDKWATEHAEDIQKQQRKARLVRALWTPLGPLYRAREKRRRSA